MIIFIAIGTVMLVSAMWLLLRPLLARTTRTTIPRHELNVRIAQQRLAELQIELKNEQLSETDFNTTQTDLEDSLLTDIESVEKSQTLKKSGPLPVLIIGALFPIAVTALYLVLGSTNYLSTESKSMIVDINSRSPNALLDELQLRLDHLYVYVETP